MIDLKQKELDEWQARNFGRHDDDLLKCALGMAEEVGEVCHHVLKGTQKIRTGVNGVNKAEIADGVADTLIYGLQILTQLGLDAEKEIAVVIDKVLQRDWKANPTGVDCGTPIQGNAPVAIDPIDAHNKKVVAEAREIGKKYEEAVPAPPTLYPCPFCGVDEAKEITTERGSASLKAVMCRNCGAKGPEYGAGTTLHILWWNSRNALGLEKPCP